MYKFLLCWRYLRTRYLALACIISVMLGVATLIVVNSVMTGFSTKLRDRLHGVSPTSSSRRTASRASPTRRQDGPDPQGSVSGNDRSRRWRRRWKSSRMLQFRVQRRRRSTRPVRLIGIDPEPAAPASAASRSTCCTSRTAASRRSS